MMTGNLAIVFIFSFAQLAVPLLGYFDEWAETAHESLGIETYDVIIVGAGMAGISAGETLTSNGVTNFKIVEAQDYVGGRTKTSTLSGLSLNVGASWIQGVPNNSMLDNPSFAKASDMDLDGFFHNWDDDIPFNPFQSPLHGIDDNADYTQSNFSAQEYFSVLDADKFWADWDNFTYCMAEMLNYTEESGSDLSFRAVMSLCKWDHVITQKYNRQMINDSLTFLLDTDDLNETLDGIIGNMVEWYSIDYEWAVSPDYVSMQEYGQEYLSEDFSLDYFITDCRGYQGVTLSVASGYLDSSTYIEDSTGCAKTQITDSRVVLNTYVSGIEYYDDGVYVYTKSSLNQASLATYAARYVILTPSVGVFQSGLIEFTPKLPFWKQVSLAEYSMVKYGALYVRFSHAFWGHTDFDLNGTYNLLFPDFDRGYFIWALNMNDPYHFFNGSNMLRLDVTECQVEKLAYMSKKQIMDAIYDKLQQYFSFQIPYPSDILYMDWYSNPYTRGAWVSYDIHLERKNFLWLRAPVKRIFFSGEATAGNNGSGFVHGAYHSGYKTATEVVTCMQTNDTGDDCPIYQFDWNDTSEAPCHESGVQGMKNVFENEVVVLSALVGILVFFI